eukprot:365012-Chlamydomonas_euryale.AAC.4
MQMASLCMQMACRPASTAVTNRPASTFVTNQPAAVMNQLAGKGCLQQGSGHRHLGEQFF